MAQRKRWTREKAVEEVGLHVVPQAENTASGPTTPCAVPQRKRWTREKAVEEVGLHIVPQAENMAGGHIERDLLFGANRKSEFSRYGTAAAASFSSKKMANKNSLLFDNAWCLPNFLCESGDFRLFHGLSSESNFREAWMSGGSKFSRPSAIGSVDQWNQSPCYRECMRKMVAKFRLSDPIWTLTNMYRTGEDVNRMHQDRHIQGVNFTCGASFGVRRSLEFSSVEDVESFRKGIMTDKADRRGFTFPQSNGDIFAFSDVVNRHYYHAVPKMREDYTAKFLDAKNHGVRTTSTSVREVLEESSTVLEESSAHHGDPVHGMNAVDNIGSHGVGTPTSRISLIVWGQRKLGNDGVTVVEWDYEEAYRKDPDGFVVHIAESPVFAHHLQKGKEEKIRTK